MLPILRIFPVGGVFLAIMILVLSLSPPGGSRPGMPRAFLSARGPLIQKDEHPEWRQMLILAALRRANEVNRLRELPDTTFVIEIPQDTDKDTDKDADKQNLDTGKDAGKVAGKIAGLPIERNDADPEDVTGSINEMPGATIPIDIGETSSTELPMNTREESPPVIKTPERAKPPRESRRKNWHHARRTAVVAAAKSTVPPPFNLLELIFDSFQAKTPPAGTVPGRQSAAAAPTPQ